MTGSRFFRNLAAIAILAVVYFVAGKLGLKLAFVHPSVTAVWPPTGIALAALMILGYRVWPGILLGAFVVNLTTAGSVATSVGIAVGNTLEGLVGAYLVSKYAGGRRAFDRPHDVLKFAVLGAMLSTTVSATFGVTSLSLGGFASWANYGRIWLTWWLGDGVSAALVAPLLLLWSTSPRLRWNQNQMLEATVLAGCLSIVGQMVFFPSQNLPLEFLCIPVLIWAAWRFGQRGAVTAVSAFSVFAIWCTLHSFGPFVGKTQDESLLLLQAFVATLALTGLVLAAAIKERKRATERFQLVVEATPNAIVVVGQQGKILLVNHQTEKIFDYKREQLVGQAMEMLVPECFRSGHSGYGMGFFAQPQARPMGASRDLYALRKDGSEFPVEIGFNPIEMDEGISVLSAIVDITERKRAEEAQRRAHEELELQVQERTKDLSKAIEALQTEISERKQAENAVGRLSRCLLQSQDEERRRISLELHDSTGQKAAALAIDLAIVGAEAAALQPRARKALEESLTLSEQIAREVRTLSYLLHPPMLDEIGLAPAIRWYADGVAQRSGLQMDLKVPRELGRLPREAEIALFRIVQESLTNIVLHSGSKKAKIRITQDSQKVTLEVCDEGRGIPPGILDHFNETTRGLGVGIVGMRERMKQLGGRLELDSGSRGTVVKAILPPGGGS